MTWLTLEQRILNFPALRNFFFLILDKHLCVTLQLTSIVINTFLGDVIV